MTIKLKRMGLLIIGVLLFVILCCAILVPLANDNAACKTAQSIKGIPLPNNTEIVETFSAAGKLVGNGNGMQYLGGILIRSELSLEDIRLYYSQYANNEWECIVERQIDKNIAFIEHSTISLEADIDGNDYFIVYSWGDNTSIFSGLEYQVH